VGRFWYESLGNVQRQLRLIEILKQRPKMPKKVERRQLASPVEQCHPGHMSRQKIGVLLSTLALVLLSCRGNEGEEQDGGDPGEGDLEYYCFHYVPNYCRAFQACNYSVFRDTFRSLDDCYEIEMGYCETPDDPADACTGATREETEACRAYLVSNTPDGCDNLFGFDADLSPCTDICD